MAAIGSALKKRSDWPAPGVERHDLAHSIHEGVQEGMMGGDEAVGLA
jgi:hypothetical protein